jgi:hypothetical protein
VPLVYFVNIATFYFPPFKGYAVYCLLPHSHSIWWWCVCWGGGVHNIKLMEVAAQVNF